MPNLNVLAVAVVDRHQAPLWVQTYPDENGTLFGSAGSNDTLLAHYYLHMALDVVEEKLSSLQLQPQGQSTASTTANNSNSSPTRTPADSYLGQLFSLENIYLYGYVTHSRVTFLVMIKALTAQQVASLGANASLLGAPPKDMDVKQFMRRIHQIYVQWTLNPFYRLDTTPQLNSPTTPLSHSTSTTTASLAQKGPAKIESQKFNQVMAQLQKSVQWSAQNATPAVQDVAL